MNVIRLCVFSTAIALSATTGTYGGQTIPGIDVIIRKTCPPPAGGGCPTKVALGEGGLSSVPADLFGPGSLPFEGLLVVDFDGIHLNRLSASNFPAENPSTIPTELLQLSLTSLAPIEPVPGHMYDVEIEMSGAGSLTLLETNPAPDGGGVLIDSFFDITYQIQFLPRDGTPGGPLNLNGAMVLEFAALTPSDPIPWSNFLPGGNLPPGGTNFVLGSDGTQLFEFRLQSPDGEFFLPLIAAVPEPTGLALVGLAMFAGGLLRRRS